VHCHNLHRMWLAQCTVPRHHIADLGVELSDNLEVLTLRLFYHLQKSSGTHWEGEGGPRARLNPVKRYGFPRAHYGGGVYNNNNII